MITKMCFTAGVIVRAAAGFAFFGGLSFAAAPPCTSSSMSMPASNASTASLRCRIFNPPWNDVMTR